MIENDYILKCLITFLIANNRVPKYFKLTIRGLSSVHLLINHQLKKTIFYKSENLLKCLPQSEPDPFYLESHGQYFLPMPCTQSQP